MVFKLFLNWVSASVEPEPDEMLIRVRAFGHSCLLLYTAARRASVDLVLMGYYSV